MSEVSPPGQSAIRLYPTRPEDVNCWIVVVNPAASQLSPRLTAGSIFAGVFSIYGKQTILARVDTVQAGSAAEAAGIKTGDVILAVKGEKVASLASFYRKVWSLGNAGVEIPLTLYRDGDSFEVRVNSSDRAKFLKGPKLH